MDDLIKQISEKTGLSEEMSKSVVSMVVDHLKDKLPAPIASQLDGVLGDGESGGTVDNLTKGLGGLFG